MRIEERLLEDIAIVKVRGDIVLNGLAIELSQRVHRLLHHRRHVLIELSDVRRVDGSCIGELADALTAAHHLGGSVTLAGVSTRLRDLLIITRLVDAFALFDTEGEAVRSLHGPARVH